MSLKWTFRRYDVDFFGHCWFSEKATNYTKGENVGSVSIETDSLEALNEQISFKKLEVEEPRDFEHDVKERISDFPPARLSLNRYAKKSLFPVFLSQFYSISKVIRMLEGLEAERYKFVVLTRYDIVLYKFPHSQAASTDKLLVKSSSNDEGFSDKIFVGKLDQIRDLDVYPHVWNLVCSEKNLSPEYLKKRLYEIQRGINNFSVTPFWIRINRGGNWLELLKYLITVLRN